MVCYWSISARLPYTFLLPFVLRPATFVHAETLGGTRGIGRREERWEKEEHGSPTQEFRVPRAPHGFPKLREEKHPLTPSFFFFLSRISRKVFARERKVEEPLWNISWSQCSIQRENCFFLWLKLNFFRLQILLLYFNIFSYFAVKMVTWIVHLYSL